MVSEECPYCHKFLGAELVTKQEIDTANILKEKDAFYRLGVPVETGEKMVENPEMFVTYKLGFKCRQCGKEWSNFKVEGVKVPRESAEGEDEVSDFDVEVDEDDPVEEQFAEE